MKKIISIFAALTMLLSIVPAAMAETTIDFQANRGISLQEVGLNETPEGVSPTTGLALDSYDVPDGFAGLAATGTYLPMLVQIDNYDGGTDDMAPWGASYADILYETPLHKDGYTRISMLFSDLLPDSVGPVRSARVGHCWLREEWDAGFLFYGGQEADGSNIRDVFRKYGANGKGVLFDGTSGENKPWMPYYSSRAGLVAPHDKDGNVAAMSALIPADHVAPNHAFRFTDEIPAGDTAEVVNITWGTDLYNSVFEYDADSNQYFRYMNQKGKMVPYVDRDTQEQLAFANVIVQHTKVTYNGSYAAPVTEHIGEGNADFFMGGVHIAGYWKRDDMASRTVFYGPDGNEIELQRGTTFVSIIPTETKVSYE